jgi:hypothetical protein
MKFSIAFESIHRGKISFQPGKIIFNRSKSGISSKEKIKTGLPS